MFDCNIENSPVKPAPVGAGDVGQTGGHPSRAVAVLPSHFHTGTGQACVHLTGRSTRSSSGNGASNGQIVGRSNGEGRGVACRAIKPKENK